MKLNTRNFGEIEIKGEKIITFEEGLPGFETLRQFAFIESKEGVFNYLQSLEEANLCFVIADPYLIFQDYAPVINESYFEKLGGGDNDVFAIYSIVCIREDIADSTINLAGPILIQTEYKKGIQVITEDKKYSVRQKLIGKLNGGE